MGDAARLKPAPTRVWLISTTSDRIYASELIGFLVEEGFARAPDQATADAVVVLESEAALDDPEWHDAVERPLEGGEPRFVPIRIGSVDDERVPARLRWINGISLDPAAPRTTWQTVAAALRTSPARHRLARQLAGEAELWQAHAVRPPLAECRRLAIEASSLLEALDGDTLLRPSSTTVAYVEFLRQCAGSRRWFVLGTRAASLLVLLLAGLLLWSFLPAMSQIVRANSAARFSDGEEGVERQMPEWTAMRLASVLLDGTHEQRLLARRTLSRTMAAPWSLRPVNVGAGYVVEGIKPLAHSDATAVVVRRVESDETFHFAVFSVETGAMVWSVELDGAYWSIDVTADEELAVVAGRSGISLVDMREHTVRRLPGSYEADKVRITGDGRIVVATRDGELLHLSVDSAVPRTVAEYEHVLDLRATSDGTIRALVTDGGGRYALFDALAGVTVAEAAVAEPLVHAGAVSTDAPRAVVVGGDGQLWAVEPGLEPQPTGIAVPDRTEIVVALSDDRYVLDGQLDWTRVVHLSTGIELGGVCREVPPRVLAIEPSVDGRRIACATDGINAIWEPPEAPSAAPPAGGSDELVQSRGDVTVTSRANEIRLTRVSDTGADPPWIAVFTGDVSAVAISPDGTRALVGSWLGELAVVDVTGWAVQELVIWRTPDGAPVVEVAWAPTPFATTAAGLTWATPDCAGCATDEGLLDELSVRLKGCWSEGQLADIEAAVRRRLEARACRPFGE